MKKQTFNRTGGGGKAGRALRKHGVYSPKLTQTEPNGLPKYEGGIERIHPRLDKPIKIY